MGPNTLVYNPMYDMRNRFTRRRAMKLVAKDEDKKANWPEQAYRFKPDSTPHNLGINKYKALHRTEPKRVVYYKEEMWKALHELKEE